MPLYWPKLFFCGSPFPPPSRIFFGCVGWGLRGLKFKIMSNSIKDIYRDIDLYGDTVLIKALKGNYKTVATRNKTIPGGGSPCYPSKFVREDLKVKRVIFHRNNEVTVFFNIPDGPDTAVARFF